MNELKNVELNNTGLGAQEEITSMQVPDGKEYSLREAVTYSLKDKGQAKWRTPTNQVGTIAESRHRSDPLTAPVVHPTP